MKKYQITPEALRVKTYRRNGMIEYYCKVNESPKTDKEVADSVLVDIVAQYLLNEICSNYEYTWENAVEGDKDAFRYYATEIIKLMK